MFRASIANFLYSRATVQIAMSILTLLVTSTSLADEQGETPAARLQELLQEAHIESAHPSIVTIQPLEEKIALLQMLADQIAANIETISTWQGVYKFVDKQRIEVGQAEHMFGKQFKSATEKPPYIKEVEGTVRFAIDRPAESLSTEMEVMREEVRSLVSQKSAGITGLPFHQRSIVTPEHYLSFEPGVVHGEFIDGPTKPSRDGTPSRTDGYPISGRAAFRDPLKKAEGQNWGIIVDPLKLFGYAGSFPDKLVATVALSNWPPPTSQMRKLQNKSSK